VNDSQRETERKKEKKEAASGGSAGHLSTYSMDTESSGVLTMVDPQDNEMYEYFQPTGARSQHWKTFLQRRKVGQTTDFTKVRVPLVDPLSLVELF
jgi:hypothetical protein